MLYAALNNYHIRFAVLEGLIQLNKKKPDQPLLHCPTPSKACFDWSCMKKSIQITTNADQQSNLSFGICGLLPFNLALRVISINHVVIDEPAAL